jgi:hypothetical protein
MGFLSYYGLPGHFLVLVSKISMLFLEKTFSIYYLELPLKSPDMPEMFLQKLKHPGSIKMTSLVTLHAIVLVKK